MTIVDLRNQIHELRRVAQKLREPEARDLRRKILEELAALLPRALRQARAGKPALLRLITRAAR